MWERSTFYQCLLYLRSEDIVFEDIVQELSFVSHFLSQLFTVENLTSKREWRKGFGPAVCRN